MCLCGSGYNRLFGNANLYFVFGVSYNNKELTQRRQALNTTCIFYYQAWYHFLLKIKPNKGLRGKFSSLFLFTESLQVHTWLCPLFLWRACQTTGATTFIW